MLYISSMVIAVSILKKAVGDIRRVLCKEAFEQLSCAVPANALAMCWLLKLHSGAWTLVLLGQAAQRVLLLGKKMPPREVG